MEIDAVLASEVKFALQVLLGDLEVPQGHGDVFVPQQLHESGQADAQTQHGRCEGVPQSMWGNRSRAPRASGGVG
jgi:hypothetical protein